VTDQVSDAPTVRIIDHILLEEEQHVNWGQAIYEELADTPERRRTAMEWQMNLEDLLIKSGGVTGGR
jgi:1,2-phenylacetyl-CoA epoxidase catalytic subunit